MRMVEVTPAEGPRAFPAMTREERRDLTLVRLMGRLPVRAVSRLGATLGQWSGRRGHPAAAARTAQALASLRPDYAADPELLEAAQRRLWANIGRVYAEFCVLERIVREGRVSFADEALLGEVIRDGRPVIIAYVHLGNWETTGMQLATRAPHRICAMADRLPANRIQAEVAASQRARWPGSVISVNAMAWRRVLAHLQTPGGILYIAIDEHAGAGVRTPAFGRAPAVHGNLGKIVRLAARTGAIILPTYSERLPGARFRAHFLEPLYPPAGDSADTTQLQARMQALDALFAPIVLRHLDQWFGLLEFRP
jgi:KDO2-lipid IV(A) lauroyltransferase